MDIEAKKIIEELLNAMEIQENREKEWFHLSQQAMRNIWDSAKKDALDFLHGKTQNPFILEEDLL